MSGKSIVMFLGCLIGGLIGLAYAVVAAKVEMGPNLFSTVLYGVFIGLFVADFLSLGMSKKEA